VNLTALPCSQVLPLVRKAMRTRLGAEPEVFEFVGQHAPAGTGSDQVSKAPSSVGPGVWPTSAFCNCILTGMHGPFCTVWANLTAFC
jgi:hypothetical protein